MHIWLRDGFRHCGPQTRRADASAPANPAGAPAGAAGGPAGAVGGPADAAGGSAGPAEGGPVMAAGVIALLALAVTVASLAWLHLRPTGLSPVRNAVSQYGITEFRVGYRVATIAFGAAGLALAVGLGQVLHRQGRAVVVLLVIFAIARAVISWFPMDAPGTDRTPTGQMHGLLAIAAFLGATLAAFRLADVLSRQGTWHSLAPVSAALGGAMVACLIGMVLARTLPAVRARFGAIERGFYLSAIAWFTVFASACATGAR